MSTVDPGTMNRPVVVPRPFEDDPKPPTPPLSWWDKWASVIRGLFAGSALIAAAVAGCVGQTRLGTPITQKGVVPVTSNGGFSSGVIVGPELVLTSDHGTKAGGVTAAWCAATVIARDPSADLALLKVTGLKGEVVPIAGSQDEVTGSAVLFGLPGGFGFKATRVRVDEHGKLSRESYPGNSGGPLINNDGLVIGICINTHGVATAAQIRSFVSKAGYCQLIHTK